MTSLFSAPRIVLIDDEPQDAYPMIEAFSRYAIPVAWYRGTGPETMPDMPLRNVRLILLDLQLGTTGVDVKNAAGRLCQAVAPTAESGPMGLVLWTKHNDHYEAFKDALNGYNENDHIHKRVQPLFILSVEKRFKSESGQRVFDIPQLISEIDRILQEPELDPCKNLFVWERLCAAAAAESVSTLSSIGLALAEFDIGRWKAEFVNVLKWLTESVSGDAAGLRRDEIPNSSSLFEALAMIHEDYVHSLAFLEDRQLERPFDISALDSRKGKAVLNTFLITTMETKSDVPGTLLPMREMNTDWLPFIPSEEDKEFRRMVSSIFGKEYNHNKEEIYKNSEPVILEITPECDYVNKKRSRLRFIPGLIVTDNLQSLALTHTAYSKHIGPLFRNDKVCYLIIECRYLFSLRLSFSEQLNQPFFRLRSHVLKDIQAWVGGHISRPGHISISAR